MKDPAQAIRLEPRWPVALAILVVLALLMVSTSRVRPLPPWLAYVFAAGLLLPMAGVSLSRAHPRWLRIEGWSTLLFATLVETMTLATLVYMVREMVNRPANLGGLQLLASSICVWTLNVLAFSLVYWRIDRGGPEARANGAGTRPDWLFPQAGAPDDAPPGWQPTYVDYLHLAFSTATAFSTTDAPPLTSRAKLLMMAESGVSLMTLVVVASRAINILG